MGIFSLCRVLTAAQEIVEGFDIRLAQLGLPALARFVSGHGFSSVEADMFPRGEFF